MADKPSDEPSDELAHKLPDNVPHNIPQHFPDDVSHNWAIPFPARSFPARPLWAWTDSSVPDVIVIAVKSAASVYEVADPSCDGVVVNPPKTAMIALEESTIAVLWATYW